MMRLSAWMVAVLICTLAGGISGCRTPGVLTGQRDSLSERLNSPLNGDLQFADADNGMNAPAPADFRENAAEKSPGNWSELWAKFRRPRTLVLPRTDFRADQEPDPETSSATALDAGF